MALLSTSSTISFPTDPRTLSGAVAEGLHAFRRRNWLRILVAAALLLLMAALWIAVPQVGQAQGAAPAQPTGLTATAGGAQATLTWDDPSDSSIIWYEYLQAQGAKLAASDGGSSDYFGYSIAVDGDTAVVGADGDPDGGAAYLFTRLSGAWSQVAKLTAFDGDLVDFGWSVAVDADTVVVGAYRDDDNGDEFGLGLRVHQAGRWVGLHQYRG